MEHNKRTMCSISKSWVRVKNPRLYDRLWVFITLLALHFCRDYLYCHVYLKCYFMPAALMLGWVEDTQGPPASSGHWLSL